MKKGLKRLLLSIFIVLIIAMIYFIFKAITLEKQKIDIKYNSNASDSVETIISVLDENNNTKKSTINLQLLDAKNKKVKGVRGKYTTAEGEIANCVLAVPENLESGNYNLKVVARSGLLTTKKIININISNKNNSEILIALDKGIYKPGDAINYRALIISKKDNTPKNNKEVSVEIFDGNGNKVYSESATTTEFGVVSGSFTLAKEVNSGTYTILVNSNSKKQDKTFTVNPYVLPQFEATITSDKDIYQLGEMANITVNAKYFFGEPVVNATVVGKIGDTEIQGLTDNSGNFVYTYEMTEKGEKDIKLSVTDTSNYLIEANKKIYAQEYAFEIETIFENGYINKNVDNNIYISAKKIDGTPVKVHASVNIGKISRQVITDENGFGTFEISAADTSNFSDVIPYQILATDNEGNTYSNNSEIEVMKNSVSISTNKIKYNQGEDIEISLNSITDSAKRTIYVCKNDEIIKMISTDSSTVKLNLDDISGLIDIFVEGKLSDNYNNTKYGYDIYSPYNYNNNDYIRKTIFIKPAKGLNIGISTDKTEYQPGENLNLNFKVQNQNDENIDANILVSILDEAVLSLAENDLSMDNIRLALQDIKLTDDITAADLYADVLDDKSESNLTLALLRQQPSDPSVKESKELDYYKSDYYKVIFGLAIGLAFVTVLYVGVSGSTKLKNVAKDIFNVITLTFIVYALCGNTIYYWFDNYEFMKSLILSCIVAIIIYCLALYKKRDKIFDLIKQLVVYPGIYFGLIYLAYELFDISGEIAILLILVVPVIMTILIVIDRKHELNKFWNTIKELSISLVKSGISYFIAGIITNMFYADQICFIIVLIISYLIVDKIYNVKNSNNTDTSKNQLSIGQFIAIGVFIVLIIFAAKIYNSFNYRYEAGSVVDYDDYNGPHIDFNKIDQFGDTATNSNSISKGFNALEDIFDNSKNMRLITKDSNTENVAEETTIDESISNTIEEETENVRNVFLESLAFIPDLIAKDGEVSTQIKLSDNITTWNIQAVGNAKDGNIGSASTTFKVFKEFFIDFSLPTNSIVTDKTSIPVTIYNYKDTALSVNLNVVANDWSDIGNYTQTIEVDSNSTQLVYIPLEIIKAGSNVLRIEAKADGVSDIVERKFEVTPNGYKKAKVISSGTIDKDFSTDYFTTEEAIENTRKLKVKIYPAAISQAIEGMESIFKMPTGCFEQTSSSLYPNILALKYLEDNNLDNEEIREKALEYISTGYQRLLTFEVPGEKGGYSLFGDKPAEPVITAFGVMELQDAKDVYDVDEKVIENMVEYLFSEQKIDGSFNINSRLETGVASSSDLAMNAYIIWALSEVVPKDERLDSSVKYLEEKINKADDNYTLALMANVFTNTNSKEAKTVINKLLENIQETSDSAYIVSNIRDYYGTYGIYQNLQTTALTSIALTKNNLHTTTNNSLIKYLAANKDSYGNWGTTQATILSLKAINMASSKGKIAGQTIQVSINDKTKEIKVGNNPLDIYEVDFDNIKDENKISLDIKKGNLAYELIEEYYVPYESIAQNEDKYSIDISQTINTNVRINDNITQVISMKNNSKDIIANGVITVNIPQGCTLNELYLERAVTTGIIEKYEYNYNTLNLYLRNFKVGDTKNIEIYYRANYPEEIVGGAIRVYDYYNPTTEGVEEPVKILVTE